MNSRDLRLYGLCGALAGLLPPGVAEAQVVKSAKPIVASVDGVEITEDELRVEAQTMQLRKQEYELKVRALDNIVPRKILERAAAAKKLSVEDFLKHEVDDTMLEPTAAEVEGFYWGQKDKFREPLNKISDQVVQALKWAKIQDGRQALLDKLRRQAVVRILIEPPRANVEIGNAPRRGSSSAPVTIVEFGDYQCPYCKASASVLQQLSTKYGDKVSLVFKDFPLQNIHPQAQGASEAAQCAREQGKYWQYHDALFAAPSLGPDVLLEAARQVQVDLNEFQACTATSKYRAVVDGNALQARQLGLNSTPSFFINGVPVTGAQPISVFEGVIDRELAIAESASKP